MTKRVNRDDIDKFHDYSLHIPSRTLYMGSENYEDYGESGTDGAMAERVIKNLHILESISKDPILVIMNNFGGDVNHGLAIYDAIKGCQSHVTIRAIGYAMSMGSIILQAADNRVMTPKASQMIHYGHLSIDKVAGTTYKIVAEAKREDEWMEQMYLEKIREKKPSFKLKHLKEMLSHDTFLTAQESVDLGLADSIYGTEETSE